jgi:hypothetical protein
MPFGNLIGIFDGLRLIHWYILIALEGLVNHDFKAIHCVTFISKAETAIPK